MQRLGPYQLLRKIGRGGMAQVWSAKRSAGGTDKFVAIKLLATHLAEQQQYRDMFLAEARLSMLLSHSNIVHVFDAVDAAPDCYMVMELVEGMTLAQLERALGKQGLKIPVEVSAYVIGELLRALGYAHGVSLDAGSIIVHRDVSPQNVMVTTSGEVKLMDFGIARFASEETQGTFVKGKLQYMPPEQLRKETRKPTIDLYAVGGILHELLDGRRFRGDIDQARLIGMVIQGEVPALQVDEPVPDELDHLRRGLLEPEEEQRIQSARDALQLLARWPGYRNAALELEGLVRRFVQPASATSTSAGYYEDSSVVSYPRDPSQDSGVRGSQREPTSDSNIRRVDPRAAAETLQSGVEATDASLELISSIEHRPAPRKPTKPSGSPRWLWAAASLVLLLGIGGVATLMLAKDDEPVAAAEPAPAPAPEAPTPEAPTQPEPPPVELEPTPTQVEPEPPPVEPEPIATPPDLPPAPSEPELTLEDPPTDDVARPLVWVEFVANEFFFVYVRVNGKILSLEPKSRVRLPVGSFNVHLRTDKEAEWIKAGRITVEADREYRVEMRKPAGLDLVEVPG
ncbi:serine/threonine-protein kinase [Nannocystaceae bacterium ST9]